MNPHRDCPPMGVRGRRVHSGCDRSRLLQPGLRMLLALCLAPVLHGAGPWTDATALEPLQRVEHRACTIEASSLSMARTVEFRPTPILAEAAVAPSFLPPLAYLPVLPAPGQEVAAPAGGTDWTAALHQSGRFLFIQHAVRISTQRKTRRELRGPFLRDYVNSVRGISGWDDGDSFLTNYIGHPMQGSISGYFQVHNHPRERLLEFSSNRAYWKSRFKAMAFNAAYSTHYELGPLGEAAIGNVGLRPGTKGAVDLVITPTLGFAWMVGEDAIDAKIIAPLERRLRHPGSRRLLRTALNPTRTFANFLRGVAPWHRDTRGDVR